MVTFANNWVAQDKRKKELSNKVRNDSDHPTGANTKNQTGRKVDRLTKPSMASLKPAEVNEGEVQIYCARIIEIINKI
jgi:hypothetical protein